MRIVCAVCLALFVVGCGVYSFSSSSLGGIKTVAVPQFENKTGEYGLEGDLTAKVIDRLISDNVLKVVALADADAVLRGEVVRYERVAYTYDKSDNVSEYKVNIYVNFTLTRKGGKALLERNNMLGFGVYDAAEQNLDDGKQAAIDKLARDIVDETTKTW
jgi:outer membrane lipopolysaccharide assembly protein LptE/RlpB